MAAFSAMPYESWPAIDRALWFEAMSASELLDSGAIAATWRDATRATVTESYGYAVDWLLKRGHLRSHERPSQRWSKPVLADYIADLKKHVSAVTTKQRVLNLERALAAMEPESDRSLLRLAVRRLETPVSHAQKRERLQECQRRRDFAAVGRSKSAAVMPVRSPSISGGFLLVASHPSVVGAGGGLDLVRH